MDEIKTQLEALQQTVNKQNEEITTLRENLLKLRRSLLLPPNLNAQESETENCKLLLDSPHWPAAVDPGLICNLNSEQDKEDRAEGVLDLIIDMPLENLKFLDFGCGEGHIVNRSQLQKPKLSVGYDIHHSEKWAQWPANESIKFTTNWEDVKANGPYNAILLYDVFDHIQGEESVLVEEMCKIKAVLAPYGKIYVRCHPWCSRHGTHLYQQINKAYVHLVFSEEELEKMGYKGMWTRQLIHPVNYYQHIFTRANIRILRNAQVQSEPIEPFFVDTFIVQKRIKWPWRHSHEHDLRWGLKFPYPCGQQFVDYVLG